MVNTEYTKRLRIAKVLYTQEAIEDKGKLTPFDDGVLYAIGWCLDRYYEIHEEK